MARDPSFENAISFAQDLIRIPSPPGREGGVTERVIREMELLEFDEVRMDGMGNAIGVVRGLGDGPSVMLNCHMDVVAEGDPAQWEFPPFDAVVSGGFLHGRGSMDIKGPLALQTYAAAALRGKAPGDVIVAHTVFEERGGWGMEALLEGGEVKPDAVIIGEATKGDITTGHRGRGEVEIVIRGLAGHASAPDRARNALDLVPQVLMAVEDLAGRQPDDPDLGRASLVPTGIEARPESRNVIPDEVVVVLDWRVLPGSTNEDLLQQVRETLSHRIPMAPQGWGLEVRMAKEVRPPTRGSPNSVTSSPLDSSWTLTTRWSGRPPWRWEDRRAMGRQTSDPGPSPPTVGGAGGSLEFRQSALPRGKSGTPTPTGNAWGWMRPDGPFPATRT